MRSMLSRRGILRAIAGTAVTGAVSTSLDLSSADAAAPTIGSIAARRMWGSKTVRMKIEGTSRTRSVKVARTKPMYEGTTKKVLNRGGLCHWFGTPAPLERGNCVLFGHRTSAGGPLRNSHLMKVGDIIEVTYGGRTLTYTVAEPPLVVLASDYLSVATWGAPNVPCLTLVACTKLNKLPSSTKYRLLIRAQAV